MKPATLISSLALAATSAILLTGCGGTSNATAPAKPRAAATPQPASTMGSKSVRMDGFKFVPASLTVGQGAGITVTNDDSTAHTATADDGRSFDTGTVAPGSSRTIDLSKPGRYPYHCSIHPFMHGTIVID